MDSAIALDRHSAAAERQSSVLVSEGLLTPPPQLSFAAAVSSPSQPPRGAYGLFDFVKRLITSETDLTVSSLRNPNYAGAVNYLRAIIENGKIIQVLPEVPEERNIELLCAAMEQLKLYAQPIAACAPSSPGMSLFRRPSWLPLPASAVSGHTMAPLVPALGPARSRSCFGSTTSCRPSSASTISRTASNKG